MDGKIALYVSATRGTPLRYKTLYVGMGQRYEIRRSFNIPKVTQTSAANSEITHRGEPRKHPSDSLFG